MERELQLFIDQHVGQIRPLERNLNLAYWEAASSGEKEAYDRYAELQLKLRKIYSDREEFEQLGRWQESGKIKDPLLKRQLVLLHNAFWGNQIDSTLLEQIVRKSAEVEKKFNTYRARLDDQEVGNNEINEILRHSTENRRRKRAWEASKQIGRVVYQDLLELVNLRNQAARRLGFDNYYLMSLELSEQRLDELKAVFDELAQLTDEPFRTMKVELDSLLAVRYGIDANDMRPWHYHDPFFQEAPQVYDVELDSYYKNKDVKDLAQKFYESIGLEVNDILSRSDLYERRGKDQHAFCTDIDRRGDVRVLANLRNDGYWMNTILHELGHAVYDKYVDRGLPYLLRQPAHIFVTEAIAMFFGRLSRNPAWLQAMVGLSDEEKQAVRAAVSKNLRLQQLVFARWCQVMFHFEQELYENPDQNLNALWWDLVEHYQYVKRPEPRDEPDWAAKIHLTSAPVYYHNYMLGELLASQIQHALEEKALGVATGDDVAYVGERRVGEFLRDNVFAAAARYRWDEMVRRATGEPLTAKYFVQQFVNGKFN